MPISKVQIKNMFAEWLDIPANSIAWHFGIMRAIELLGQDESNVRKLCRFIVLELFDPDNAASYKIMEPYASEVANLRRLLMSGDTEAYNAIPTFRIFAAANEEAGEVGVPAELISRKLSRADRAFITAVINANVAIFSNVGIFGVTLLMPICLTIQQVLSAHREQSGEAVMQAALEHIAERLEIVLSDKKEVKVDKRKKRRRSPRARTPPKETVP